MLSDRPLVLMQRPQKITLLPCYCSFLSTARHLELLTKNRHEFYTWKMATSKYFVCLMFTFGNRRGKHKDITRFSTTVTKMSTSHIFPDTLNQVAAGFPGDCLAVRVLQGSLPLTFIVASRAYLLCSRFATFCASVSAFAFSWALRTAFCLRHCSFSLSA